MNSVAVPASAPAGVLSAEGELVRQAAHGDSEAFAELFRRHGQMAWRLAQAVAPDRDAAVTSVANGFTRALQGAGRRRAERDAGFRPAVLGAVYRHAIDDARARAADRPASPAPARTGDHAVMATAFRSLPERWRAALWLTEVESIAPERMAAILGVSAAAAGQLIIRGRRGLDARLAQAHAETPEHLAPALRAVALPMPANLAEMVAGAWGTVATGPGARVAPINLWLSEHAVRPLQVSVVALIGLGVIGLGLVGEGNSVTTPQVAAPSTPQGSLPAGSLSGGAGSGSAGANIPGLVINTSPGAAFTGGPGAASATAGSAAAGGAAAGSHAGTTAGQHASATTLPGPGATTPTTATSVPGTTTPTTTGTTVPTPTTLPPTQSPTTVLNLAPVASVTSSGGSTSVNVLPTKSGSTATVTVGCSTGVGITIGQITVGCPAPHASTTTPTTNPSSGGLLGGLLGGL